MTEHCPDCKRPKAESEDEWIALDMSLRKQQCASALRISGYDESWGDCLAAEVALLRSQATEREALLARGAELIEQDLKEIASLRAELATAKLSLWQYNRPHGYDVNGRTYSEAFGLCSHGVMLFRDCEKCNAGSGRPRPVIEEEKLE